MENLAQECQMYGCVPQKAIARPFSSLCTLHAAITGDYATLAYRLVANLCRVALADDRVHLVLRSF